MAKAASFEELRGEYFDPELFKLVLRKSPALVNVATKSGETCIARYLVTSKNNHWDAKICRILLFGVDADVLMESEIDYPILQGKVRTIAVE